MSDNVFAFDYNGDKKSDLFLYRPGAGIAWVIRYDGDDSNGNAKFKKVYSNSVNGIAGFSLANSKDRVFPFDYNGDGKSDLFLYRREQGIAWVARYDRQDLDAADETAIFTQAFSTQTGLPGFSLTGTTDFVSAFDHNGNGKSDLLIYRYLTGAIGIARSGSSKKSDLLIGLSNSNGGTTSLEYEPSSKWQNTNLPFNIYTVTSVTVNSGIDPNENYTTNYTYANGFYDSDDKEFRGFEIVTETNPDETAKKTIYLMDSYKKGKIKEIEIRETISDNSNLIKKITNQWDDGFIVYENAGDPEKTSKFVNIDYTYLSDFENGQEYLKTLQDYSYSDYTPNESYPTYLLEKTEFKVIVGFRDDDENITKTYDWGNYGDGDWTWRKTMEETTGFSLNDNPTGIARKTIYDYYTDTGNLKSVEHDNNLGSNPVTKYQYDDYGNLEYEWNPKHSGSFPADNTHSTEYGYDSISHTYPVKIINAENLEIEREYNPKFGVLNWEEDPNDNATEYVQYDEFGRIKHIKYPDDGETKYDYYDCADTECNTPLMPRYVITSVLGNDGSFIDNKWEYYDGLNRKVQTVIKGDTDAPYVVTRFYYDDMGRQNKTVGPFFNTNFDFVENTENIEGISPWVETIYDKHGRPYTATTPSNEHGPLITTYIYDGLSTTIINGAISPSNAYDHKRQELRNYLGRIVEVVEYNEVVVDEVVEEKTYHTKYAYNAAGDLTKVTDALGNITDINYNTLGQKKNMNDPDLGYWEYNYDLNGNLSFMADQKGNEIEFEYDNINRLKEKSYTVTSSDTIPTDNVTKIYDSAQCIYGKGRLYSETNGDVTTTYTAYDKMGRIKSVRKEILENENPLTYKTFNTSYSYDKSGNLQTITYPGNPLGSGDYQITYTYYPGTSLLYQVKHDNDALATYTDYEATGQLGNIIYDLNQTETTYIYNSQSSRLSNIIAGINGEILNKTYNYKPFGDIEKITDGVNNVIYEYTYDKLHRLKSEKITDGSTPSSAESLDYFYNSSHIHAVSSINDSDDFVYDANGNLRSGYDFSYQNIITSRAIEYNSDNMPVYINAITGTTQFIYDANNVRSKKIGTGGSTYYSGEHFEVKNGTGIIYIFANNARIAMIKPDGYYYFHKDHLGSTAAITDSSGQVVGNITEYMPYGLERSYSGITATDYKFTDQELDTSTNLYNYDARLYDPAIGRFISPDSIVPDWYDPQHLNRYSYCYNNPLKYEDPSGHIAVAGAFLGAGLDIAAQLLSGTSFTEINKTQVIVSAIVGATGAGLGGLASKAGTAVVQRFGSKMLGAAATTATNALGSAAIGAGSTLANNTLNGEQTTLGDLKSSAKTSALTGTMGLAVAKTGEAIGKAGAKAMANHTWNSNALKENLTRVSNSIEAATKKTSAITKTGTAIGNIGGNITSNASHDTVETTINRVEERMQQELLRHMEEGSGG